MTSEDVMKFCEKGSHEYDEVDVLGSIRNERTMERDARVIYILFQCKLCPSKWVKKI